MNSIFRKTLIASALTAIFSSGAIAADDYSKTIDGSDASKQGEMQQNDSSSTHPAMPNHEDEFNKTIDADVPRAGNSADKEMQQSTDSPNANEEEFNQTIDAEGPSAGNKADQQKQKSSDGQNADEAEFNHTLDDEGPSAGNRADPANTDRPLSEHQSNVTEEEEEEEEIGNTEIETDTDVEMKGQMDRNNDVEMNEQPHGPTGAGTPANRGGLYDMSANELNGMDVITSDGEDIGGIEKIVMSPDNQNVHAVVTVGGLLGVGGKTILIPLEKFTRTNDELHVKATQAQLKEMNDYGSEDYIELEGDAAISTALRQ